MESLTNIFPEEKLVVQKYFKIYDANADGKLSFDEFFKGIKEMVGLKKEEVQRIYNEIKPNEDDGITIETLLKLYEVHREKLNLNKIFEDVIYWRNKIQEEESSHKINLYLGQFDQTQTKLGLKLTVDQQEADELFKQAAKGLKLTKDKISIILKFQANKPNEAREKLEKVIKSIMTIVKNAIFKPNTPGALAINSVKFEYLSDADSVTLAAYMDHKGINLIIDIIELAYEKFQLNKVKGTLDLNVGFKHGLLRFFDEEKVNRSLVKIIKDGFQLSLQARSNAGVALSEYARPKYLRDVNPMLFLLIGFLQKNSKVELGLDDFNLEFFIPKQESPEGLPVKVPDLDFLTESVLINDIKKGIKTTKEMKLPVVQNILDLLQNYLNADIDFSLNLPHLFLTGHLRTIGLKEVFEILSNPQKFLA